MNKAIKKEANGMRRFSSLVYDLESLDREGRRRCWQAYAENTTDKDASWALALLIGKVRFKLTNTATLLQWARTEADLPDWLMSRSLDEVRDKCEAAALVLPKIDSEPSCDLVDILKTLEGLQRKDEGTITRGLFGLWKQLSTRSRVVLNKIVTGSLTTYRPEDFFTGTEHILRIHDDWHPGSTGYEELMSSVNATHPGLPLPFGEIEVLTSSADILGSEEDYILQPYWEGQRCQFILTDGKVYLWTDQRELVIHRKELTRPFSGLNVQIGLEGVVSSFDEKGHLLGAEEVRRQLFRKSAGSQNLTFLALDIFEKGKLEAPLFERMNRLEQLVRSWQIDHLVLADEVPLLTASSTALLVRKRTDRSRDWLLLPPVPKEMKAVVLYVEYRLYKTRTLTELTLGVWSGSSLVPIGKVPLPDDESMRLMIQELVKNATIERFGPVRSVDPYLVVSLSFRSVVVAARRKAGIALKNPQISRFLPDEDADAVMTLDELRSLVDKF